jgi:hypothetical protein
MKNKIICLLLILRSYQVNYPNKRSHGKLFVHHSISPSMINAIVPCSSGGCIFSEINFTLSLTITSWPGYKKEAEGERNERKK